MTKRKARNAAAPPVKLPVKAPVAGARVGGRGPRGTRTRSRWLVVAAVVVAVFAVVGFVVLARPGAGTPPAAATQPVGAGPIGGAMACRQLPRFVASLGFGGQPALSTSESGNKGLSLVDVGDSSHQYQHPTWTRFGYLGPITYDGQGNVYVAPTPHVSLLDNPPEQQNTLYKVDTDTGVMHEFLKLEPAAPPSPQNPFGILGLTYDCDTNSLYVASVAGSTRARELGQIARIDLATGQVAETLPGLDAMGLAVFHGARDKRLYFGSARRPVVSSVALDAQGAFSGPVRSDLSIPGLADKARRITFDQGGGMTITAVPFEFTLSAASEQRQSKYGFAYDGPSDGWAATRSG